MRTIIRDRDGKTGQEAYSGELLPLAPSVPNAETVAAMEAGRRGKLVTVGDIDGLMADLYADD